MRTDPAVLDFVLSEHGEHDPQLAHLLRADGAAAEAEIVRLIAASRPVIEGIVARYTRSGTLLTREDGEDVRSTIELRLVEKLRGIGRSPEEPIRNFRGYVATLTYNAVSDHLRKRFPERTRLKSRLRYALTHDARLAIWSGLHGPLCGIAAWRGRSDAADECPPEAVARVEAVERGAASAALEEIFRIVGRPLLFEAAVDAIADGWQIADAEPAKPEEIDHAAAAGRQEDIDFARALWSEVQELRPMQRKALLLNLRYGGETNVISLFVLAGIATFGEIAAALEMSLPELAAVWRSLPMEDARIAERFGVTRQQVINLRKAARDRLWRRLR